MGYRNAFAVVEAVNHDFPGLINDGTRFGVFVDQVAHRLNKEDGAVRWGRKARQAGGGNPNGDGLTYQNDPNDFSKKIIVDIIVSGPDPGQINPNSAPAWQEFLGDNIGNGFWMEPISPLLDVPGQPPVEPPVPPVPPVPPAPDLEARLAALEVKVESNRQRIESVNDFAMATSADAVHKPLPRYVAKVRIFGYTITVVSVPE